MRTCKTKPLCSRRHRGFSLIEVVIGMTILAMITTTLFGIIKGSVKGASDIEKLQRENDQVNRFLDQCRVTIDTMPASATLKLTMMDASSGLQEFNVSGNSTCFPFGPNPISYNDTTVGLRPDIAKPMTEGANPMPRYILGITRKDIIPQTSNTTVSVQQSGAGQDAADDQGRFWMPLLPGVVTLQWEFYKDSTKEWLQEWTTTQWPDLIKLHLTMEGRTQPLTMSFAPPELQLRPATQKAPATTSPVLAGGAGGAGKGGGGKGAGGGKNAGGGKGAGGKAAPAPAPAPAPRPK